MKQSPRSASRPAEEPEPGAPGNPRPFTAAAQAIMGNPEIMGALSGTDPAEDFKNRVREDGRPPAPGDRQGLFCRASDIDLGARLAGRAAVADGADARARGEPVGDDPQDVGHRL